MVYNKFSSGGKDLNTLVAYSVAKALKLIKYLNLRLRENLNWMTSWNILTLKRYISKRNPN